MAKVFITGSADGLGFMAGELLISEGHAVVLHARSRARAGDVRQELPGAEAVVVGNVSTLAAMRDVAAQVNRLGPFDAVIHNVAVGYREPRRVETVDGFSELWAVNVLAPYVLTALIERPQRLIYLSSGMHFGGDVSLSDLQWKKRRWNGSQAYADSKLHDTLLALGFARRWPDVHSNAVSPGWVRTKMGGPSAPDDLDQGHRTQAWLAVGEDAKLSGGYYYHLAPGDLLPAAEDPALQDRLLELCQEASGIELA
ncbi:MAG: SDR family NAD(P)-dependent oxidoreductase [Polyangiaceae bacterium]|nr:SDR family NAD(P)-dependent oxidoreductase [Myxococcales bacterium]MCB9590822.1 SDR family NAD(P)-dependent oxidoreductase [Polyangiaceae bacterium]